MGSMYLKLKDIAVGQSILTSDLFHFVYNNCDSMESKSTVKRYANKLGFSSSGKGGPNSYLYRTSDPVLSKEVQDWVDAHTSSGYSVASSVPTLQERLAAQIESGERKAPAGYSEWCAEQEKKEKGEMEQTTTVDPAIVNVAMEEPYEFETVEKTIKLVGKYGTYKVCSDGTTTVDLLVSGTLSNDELRTLERELNAVYCRTWRG
jgi:hypothetical protein